MRKFNALFLTVVILLAACSWSPNFMGAEKYGGGFNYTERWFFNPKYKEFETPKGTAFYGAAAQKIRSKYIVKYYKDRDDTIKIPAKSMWKVKHNGKDSSEQDDEDLFYYVKNNDASFRKAFAIRHDFREPTLVAVEESYRDGWCKLYPTYDGNIYYVKKSILYQGKTILNEESKKELERQRKIALRNKIKVMPAVSPWVTPPHKICVDYGGEVNSRGVCQIDNSGAAYRLCRELGARLPTIEELKVVVVQCGGQIGNHIHNDSNLSYISCYRKKGFSYEYNAYLSSTVHISKFGLKSGKKTMKFGSGVVSSSFGSNSILCRHR